MTHNDDDLTLGQRQLIADDAALQADNAAAAQDAAANDMPPVIPLGKDGGKCIIYSVAGREIHSLPADKLTWLALLDMAPRQAWERWIYPDRAADDMPGKRELTAAIQERLLDGCRGKVYDPSRLRARGVWRDSSSGGTVYNAGGACLLTPPGGKPTMVPHVHGGCVYSAGVPLPLPADTPLTAAEGLQTVDYLSARAWMMPGSGDIVAGWMVAALLAGVMPVRPHLWITAPAGAGKTVLLEDMSAALGSLAIVLEGAGTTEAAIRQTLDGAALPVLADEVEAGDNDHARGNIAGWLELMRSSYRSKHALRKGSKDGKARAYLLRSCYALYSISPCLERASDTSRCLLLGMRQMPAGAARDALWQRQEAGRAIVQRHDYPARLLARLLPMVPGILSHAAALGARLAAHADARQAEIFGVLGAGAHALAHDGDMDDAYMLHWADIMRDYAAQADTASDLSRCLETLLAYRLSVANGIGIATVRTVCSMLAGAIDIDSRVACERALATVGMTWRLDRDALQVDTSSTYMRPVYRGTQWQSGRIVAVLADGCPGKGQPNVYGISVSTYRHGAGVGNCLFLPAALVLA